MSKKYEIRLLSKQFYEDHPHKQFPQILVKKMRPYACWEIPDKPGTYLCVPFRSNMTSTDGFRFRNSTMNPDKHPHPGLDYRKAVIINNPEYFLDKKPVIDKGNFKDFKKFSFLIEKQAFRYIKSYVNYCTCAKPIVPKNFEHHTRFSTLPYFHKELSLSGAHLIKFDKEHIPIYFDPITHKVKSGFFTKNKISIPLTIVEFRNKIGKKFPAIDSNVAIRHRIAEAIKSPGFSIEISQNISDKKKEDSR